MKSSEQQIPADEKWQAVLVCDAAYDGRFWYGVCTTRIWCKPSCRSKPPRKENVHYFDTPQAALASGYRPCKRCRPDLDGDQSSAALAAQVRKMYRRCFTQPQLLSAALAGLYLSPSQVARVFKRYYGITPHQYLMELRINYAARLLRDINQRVVDVALQAGYGSLSHFYACFKQQTGLAPVAYRKLLTSER